MNGFSPHPTYQPPPPPPAPAAVGGASASAVQILQIWSDYWENRVTLGIEMARWLSKVSVGDFQCPFLVISYFTVELTIVTNVWQRCRWVWAAVASTWEVPCEGQLASEKWRLKCQETRSLILGPHWTFSALCPKKGAWRRRRDSLSPLPWLLPNFSPPSSLHLSTPTSSFSVLLVLALWNK